MPETVPRLDVPARGVHVIPGDVPEGVVPPSTSLTPPTTPHPIPDTPHPYVHLTYGPWEPSGHQCGDVQPGGCGEPIYERKVAATFNGLGRETVIGWELRDCPCRAPRPDVPDELLEQITDTIRRRLGSQLELFPHAAEFLADGVMTHLNAVVPVIERQVRERVAAEIEARGDELRNDKEYPIGREEWGCFTIAARIARGES